MNNQTTKRIGIGLVLAGLLAGITAQAAPGDGDRYAFPRYEVILKRKPFGNPPPPPPPPPEGPKMVDIANSWAKNFRLSSIKKDNSGRVTVGLVDNATSSSIMIDEGDTDTATGILVVSVDYEKEEAILRLDDEEVPMTLSGITAPASKSSKKTSSKKPFASKFTPVVTRRTSPRTSRSSPIQRPKPRYTGEELRKHLQDYNMEVIRKGLPALPIPLTADQDKKLVTEGILSPQQ